MSDSYATFFRSTTGHDILPYQERYGANPFSSTLLEVPTGLGKSDAVLMPWLYAKRVGKPSPTRLILVLPRQNLTVQTAENARRRCEAAKLIEQITVLELMAARADNQEDLRPDLPAIIVATQDLYFSRALNRGYARRPPRWPIDFALYNQDCLIVLDEIQLMDDALATSTQLAAFRKQFGIFREAPTVWMTATLNHAWLKTVDSPVVAPLIKIGEEDFENELVRERLHAAKSIAQAPAECRTPDGCARFAREKHKPGTRTLVIVNTVARARQLFTALKPLFPKALLLHSRFRPGDRQNAYERLTSAVPAEGQMVVATQVLEAGIDVTSHLLITDVAPWGSLVQRFGRVNRYGDDNSAEIWWVDQSGADKHKEHYAPYSATEIQHALMHLSSLASGSPADLPHEDGPEPWQHVLRRADLLDLFDTTPDLSGNDLDVSRFIRASDDKDAYLAWRDWPSEGPPQREIKELVDQELCSVPIGELREFAKKHKVYSWNFTLEKWDEVATGQFYPGMLVVSRCAEGGYTPDEGWSPGSKQRVEPIDGGNNPEDSDGNDGPSFPKYRQILKDHTDRVVEELTILLDDKLDAEYREALVRAAQMHDWGKAHPVFQTTLHRNDPSPDVLAKQVGGGRHSRRHFRHELASALAMLQTGESDLAAYLAAAHHGKIRMGIRSKPGEQEVADKAIAQGIIEGDQLPECEIASGISKAAVELSLKCMEFGAEGGSWTDRMLRVRDRLGPFRLAYLEMLLRMADEKASGEPRLKETACID